MLNNLDFRLRFNSVVFRQLSFVALLITIFSFAACTSNNSKNECQVGSLACACDTGGKCDNNLTCVNDTCQACSVGSANCTCDNGKCQEGMFCTADKNICRLCPQGSVGCLCKADDTCSETNAFCDSDNRCQRQDCPAGEHGCACLMDWSCHQSEAGEKLTCDSGVCISNQCPRGTPGCACQKDQSCTGDAECADGFCRLSSCTPGTEHCQCAAGSCAPGLICRNDSCLDGTGYPGFACGNDNYCMHGTRCESDVCTPCLIGSQGCSCNDDGTCNDSNTCKKDRCVTLTGLATSAFMTPKCYTPCREDVELNDGTYLTCPGDGLLEGCYGGTTCIAGQCLSTAENLRNCAIDRDCADFQACLDGVCQSNCENNSHCKDEAVCFRSVCRLPCLVSGDPCPIDSYCATQDDNENGHCLPLAITNSMANLTAAPETGSYAIDTTALEFSNTKLINEFRIANKGALTGLFIIRKVSSHLIRDDGSVEILESTKEKTCTPGNCPLYWLGMGPNDNLELKNEIEVIIDPDSEATISIGLTGASPTARWEGAIEIWHKNYGVQRIIISYTERPEGRWQGDVLYFGNFAEEGLDDWLAADNIERQDSVLISSMRNALMQVWARFRAGKVSLNELTAAIASTRSGSWQSPQIKSMCPKNAACFPYNNVNGYLIYSTNAAAIPIPSGVVELPMAINIRPLAEDDPQTTVCNGATYCYGGRIESQLALQYAGNPAVTLSFDNDPSQCSQQGAAGCILYINDFSANIAVGGRYHINDICPVNYNEVKTPWLLPGFIANTSWDLQSAQRYSRECRHNNYPFNDPELTTVNISFASSNPVPDGRTRQRSIEIIDGAVIEGRDMLVLFRERTASIISSDPNDDLMAYGLMLLHRQSANLEDDAYLGNTPPKLQNEIIRSEPVECSRDLLERIFGNISSTDFSKLNVTKLGNALITGVAVENDITAVPIDATRIHYLCEDTGLIDGGPDNYGSEPVSDACPGGSKVTYFSLATNILTKEEIATLPCQKNDKDEDDGIRTGTCQDTIKRWITNNTYGISLDLIWQCTDNNQLYCSENRLNLLDSKLFYDANDNNNEIIFSSLSNTILDAFRYRTRFVNRSGTSNVGFAPEICVENSDSVPYCYDPAAIEEIRERVDCAMDLWSYLQDTGADQATQSLLFNYLNLNFGFNESIDENSNTHSVLYGFEHLNAELLIMLGDEMMAKSLTARFDLAQSNLAAFYGVQFEPDGINLSGAAGFEMLRLYQAVQYYQLALDRFYKQTPAWMQSMQVGQSFITLATVTSYLNRLIRASTQKTLALSEIAKRYQNLNRLDLARHVIERSYAAAYLESIIITNIMRKVVTVSAAEDIAQINQQIEQAQRSYRIALSKMRSVYDDTRESMNYFGFPADYIPFPALEAAAARDNPIEVALYRANQRLQIAREAEQTALSSNRSFESDTAAFQNELARIRTVYEGQLAELCGTFAGEDGQAYPAIAKYAYLDNDLRLLIDPCSEADGGTLREARGNVDLALNNILKIRTQISNVLEEAEIERIRINDQCESINEFADIEYETNGQINIAEGLISAGRATIASIDRFSKIEFNIFDPSQAGRQAIAAGISTAIDAAIVVGECVVRQMQRDLQLKRTKHACELAEIDSDARLANILLSLATLDVDALRAKLELNQAISRVQHLRNQAKRITSEMDEMEELAINVEAARNNPNVRIYRNDAIMNAERSFYLALKEAYKATRVFEYYTGQSYASLEQLFLVRMAAVGDINLQYYLIDLEDAARAFDDELGAQDWRISRISLRDDIMQIPYLNTDGEALSDGERSAMFRERLLDPGVIDSRGYIVFPFNTRLTQTSPLTRLHKIKYVEIDVIGSDVGDPVGRLYLDMRGTGTVVNLDNEYNYYAFPHRTSVINTMFNGNRVYVPELYKSYRLIARPFVNSRWELVINVADEEVNRDINLNSLTDICLYVFYGDFTAN
ncbi:MAG: hypothetical protein JW841_17415 [Deltaproteobacteria bacterium]|nr:hypothetical protein [Deltaproteobacteria bacterium]